MYAVLLNCILFIYIAFKTFHYNMFVEFYIILIEITARISVDKVLLLILKNTWNK